MYFLYINLFIPYSEDISVLMSINISTLLGSGVLVSRVSFRSQLRLLHDLLLPPRASFSSFLSSLSLLPFSLSHFSVVSPFHVISSIILFLAYFFIRGNYILHLHVILITQVQSNSSICEHFLRS